MFVVVIYRVERREGPDASPASARVHLLDSTLTSRTLQAGMKPAAIRKERLAAICSACFGPVSLGRVVVLEAGRLVFRTAGKRRITDCAQAAALALARVGGAPGETL